MSKLGKIMTGAVLLLLCFFFTGCGNDQQPEQQSSGNGKADARPAFTSITVEEAAEIMYTKKDLLVVDVRSPQELREGKIPGSVLVPFWDILKGNHNLPKDRPLLVVCAVGGRSYGVGQFLAKTGYTEVYNMTGGLNAWKRARYPVLY